MGARHVISKVSVDKRSSAHRIVWLSQIGGLRVAAIGGQRIWSAATRQIIASPANGAKAAGNGISGAARSASAGLRAAPEIPFPAALAPLAGEAMICLVAADHILWPPIAATRNPPI